MLTYKFGYFHLCTYIDTTNVFSRCSVQLNVHDVYNNVAKTHVTLVPSTADFALEETEYYVDCQLSARLQMIVLSANCPTDIRAPAHRASNQSIQFDFDQEHYRGQKS